MIMLEKLGKAIKVVKQLCMFVIIEGTLCHRGGFNPKWLHYKVFFHQLAPPLFFFCVAVDR